jgi:addiction module HigA family antidote
LAEELEFLNMSAAGLARELHVPANRIALIVSSSRGITADTALRLGQWFGTEPEFWLNLQQQYELRVAEREVGQTIRETIVPRQTPAAWPG